MTVATLSVIMGTRILNRLKNLQYSARIDSLENPSE